MCSNGFKAFTKVEKVCQSLCKMCTKIYRKGVQQVYQECKKRGGKYNKKLIE